MRRGLQLFGGPGSIISGSDHFDADDVLDVGPGSVRSLFIDSDIVFELTLGRYTRIYSPSLLGALFCAPGYRPLQNCRNSPSRRNRFRDGEWRQ
jgi:hypothetical protein